MPQLHHSGVHIFRAAWFTKLRNGTGLDVYQQMIGKENRQHIHSGISLRLTEQWRRHICSKIDGIRTCFVKPDSERYMLCVFIWHVNPRFLFAYVCIHAWNASNETRMGLYQWEEMHLERLREMARVRTWVQFPAPTGSEFSFQHLYSGAQPIYNSSFKGSSAFFRPLQAHGMHMMGRCTSG